MFKEKVHLSTEFRSFLNFGNENLGKYSSINVFGNTHINTDSQEIFFSLSYNFGKKIQLDNEQNGFIQTRKLKQSKEN